MNVKKGALLSVDIIYKYILSDFIQIVGLLHISVCFYKTSEHLEGQIIFLVYVIGYVRHTKVKSESYRSSSYTYIFYFKYQLSTTRISQKIGKYSFHFIHSFINVSTALRWALASSRFRNLFTHTWTSDQPIERPLTTQRITQAQNKRTQTSMP
jgi:hypothetical protein